MKSLSQATTPARASYLKIKSDPHISLFSFSLLFCTSGDDTSDSDDSTVSLELARNLALDIAFPKSSNTQRSQGNNRAGVSGTWHRTLRGGGEKQGEGK